MPTEPPRDASLPESLEQQASPELRERIDDAIYRLDWDKAWNSKPSKDMLISTFLYGLVLAGIAEGRRAEREIEGGVAENRTTFCPYCGGRISETIQSGADHGE